jgi:hypothetical protein
MDYMGFYDLFDHLLDTNNVQEETAAAKTSPVPRSRFPKRPGLTRNGRKRALQTSKSFHALRSK